MSKLESTLKEEWSKYNRIENYLKEYISNAKIDLNTITKYEIDKFIEKNLIGESRSTLYTNISTLEEVLRNNGIDIQLNSSDYVDKLKFNSNKYFTKKEIRNICNMFINTQDKFIVYALWSGIMGKGYEDLANIKTSDVSADFSNINIKGKKFECDDYMKEILKYTVETDTYIKYIESAERVITEEYEFNMGSPYVIKIKPTKKNNYGLEHMKKAGIQTKLDKFSKIFSDMNIHLTGKSLERSGIMFKMFLKEIEHGTIWTIENIKIWFEKENINGHVEEIYRIYHKKYNS